MQGSTIQSAKSIASPYSNGFPTAGYSRDTALFGPPILSAQNTKQSFGIDPLDPEELFSRYSVAEVKAVQQRLRNDADIKQEELRLMVGERYRDLLQASSSIISMATSSQRVFDAIEECRGAIIVQEEPPLLSRAAAFGAVNDRHLHTLQLLSAHVKVLLDAPEHLWRLIERKNYLSAAWLFLFMRVVHRALAQHDDQDEDSWSKAGIDVITDFPLVQRQWEEVSTFRSQIIHKATLSLREIGLTEKAICATLVTLHLLDSRPLTEAFGALLTQRTKALASLVSWKIDHSLPHAANSRLSVYGSVFLPSSSSRQYLPKEILQANRSALTAITDTVHISRQIFKIPPAQKLSLISLVLHSIQEDSLPHTLAPLSSELTPSTHAILTNSSSSAHFLLLPSSLQDYKPYIDLSSSSLIYSQTEFGHVLQDWLNKSSKSWHDASKNWLNNLGNVTEIWGLRTSLRNLIAESLLEPLERSQLTGILDRLCQSRISSVWTTTLSQAQNAFQTALSSFLSKFKEYIPPRTPFKALSPPLSSQSSKSASFQHYQTSLKQQLLGRTAQLQAVLLTLEQCARVIQNDLSTVLSDESEEGIAFSKKMIDIYQPLAETTSDAVIKILEEEAEFALRTADVSRLVGVANISDELRSWSIFVTHVGCRKPALMSIRARLNLLFDRAVQRWREEIISQIFDRSRAAMRSTCASTSKEVFGPSPQCFRSLLSLSDALRELGVGADNARGEPVVHESIRGLINCYLAGEPDEPDEQGWQETTQALSDRLNSQGSVRSDIEDIELSGSEFLIRTQTLLSLLLPCTAQIRSLINSKESANQVQFLLFGTPSSLKQEYQPALELAKPSSRFGLLLVSNVEN